MAAILYEFILQSKKVSEKQELRTPNLPEQPFHSFCAIIKWREGGKWFHGCTGLRKYIPAEFRDWPSKCSAAHPKNALWHNFSAINSRNLAGMFLRYSVYYPPPPLWNGAGLILPQFGPQRECPSPRQPLNGLITLVPYDALLSYYSGRRLE